MMISRWFRRVPLLLALSVGVGSVAAPVDAQPGKAKRKENQEKRKENREERREDRKENRAERKEKRKERFEERKKHCDANPECKARKANAKKRWEEKKDERQAARKEWREKRPERRKKARAHLVEKWGALRKVPAARIELERHAVRMARLHRVRFVAEQVEDTDAVAKADELIAKEQARHQARMEAIQAKQGGEK